MRLVIMVIYVRVLIAGRMYRGEEGVDVKKG